jgi:putative transposase
MTKSARGTIKDPGKNVQVKANLNKLILDQGWNNFKQKIDYKSKWNGDEVFLVNPAYTSQQCSKCGHIAEENRPTPEEFICQKCGLEIDADINAAKNILAIGLIKQKEAKLEQLKVSKIN